MRVEVQYHWKLGFVSPYYRMLNEYIFHVFAPSMQIEVFRDGETNPDHPRRPRFTFLAGQPAEVTRAYDDAMGFTQNK